VGTEEHGTLLAPETINAAGAVTTEPTHELRAGTTDTSGHDGPWSPDKHSEYGRLLPATQGDTANAQPTHRPRAGTIDTDWHDGSRQHDPYSSTALVCARPTQADTADARPPQADTADARPTRPDTARHPAGTVQHPTGTAQAGTAQAGTAQAGTAASIPGAIGTRPGIATAQPKTGTGGSGRSDKNPFRGSPAAERRNMTLAVGLPRPRIGRSPVCHGVHLPAPITTVFRPPVAELPDLTGRCTEQDAYASVRRSSAKCGFPSEIPVVWVAVSAADPTHRAVPAIGSSRAGRTHGHRGLPGPAGPPVTAGFPGTQTYRGT